MINTDFSKKQANKLYEEVGEVGFWYFYKDAIITNLQNLSKNIIDGPKLVAKGTAEVILGFLMIFGLVILPLVFPFSKIKLAYRASKDYKEFHDY